MHGSDGTSIKKMGQEAQDTSAGATWQICKRLSQVNKIRFRRVGTTSWRGSAKRRYSSSDVIAYDIHNSEERSKGADALIISLGIT